MGRALARALSRRTALAVLVLLAAAACAPRPGPAAPETGDRSPQPEPGARRPEPEPGDRRPEPEPGDRGPEPPRYPESAPEPGSDDRASPAVARVDVAGAGEVLVVDGAVEASGVLLYLHGRCGDPEAFRAFAAAIPRSLTLMSVRGDVRCKGSSRTRWSVHTPSIDQRLRRVVDAISARRVRAGAAPLAPAGWIVFGYSEGALRAEALIARHPDRYVAGILGGGPRAPRPGALDRAGGVLLLAGDRDARDHLRAAADDLGRRGLRVKFALLPGARHGEYGPEAERVVGEGLRWLLEGPPFTPGGATLQK